MRSQFSLIVGRQVATSNQNRRYKASAIERPIKIDVTKLVL